MYNYRASLERKSKKCRNPGSNQGPLDLQSNALPTELFRLLQGNMLKENIINCTNSPWSIEECRSQKQLQQGKIKRQCQTTEVL